MKYRTIFGMAGAIMAVMPTVAAPVAAVSTAVATLPAPSGDPLHIDLNRDPFLAFMGAGAPPLPFRDRIGQAVKVYPAVEAAIAMQAETAAVRTEVRAGLFPRIDAQLIGGRSLTRNLSGDKVFVEKLSPTRRSDAVVGVDQLLFDFGATPSRIKAASARIKAAQAEVERVATDTALRGIAAYYDVLTFQTLVDLNSVSITRHREILADTRTRFTQGLGGGGDVARAEAYLADAEVQGVRFQRRLDTARGDYREIFGEDAPLHVTRPLPAKSQADTLEAAQAMSKDAPAVTAAAAQTAAARGDLSASEGDRLPRLSAGVTSSIYDLAGSANNYDVRGQIILRQSLTLGGAARAREAQARARLNRAQFTGDRVSGETARDAGIAWSDIALLETSTATLRNAYGANRRSRDMFVEQYRVSRGSLLDVLRAEQDYFAAAAAYLQGAVELDVARYTLLARTGELLPVLGVQFDSTATHP